MAQRAKQANIRNHYRQRFYLEKQIVMLPTMAEERKAKKKGGEKKRSKCTSHSGRMKDSTIRADGLKCAHQM